MGTGISEYDEETKEGLKNVKDRFRKSKKNLLLVTICYMIVAAFITTIGAPLLDTLIGGDNSKKIYSRNGVSLNLPLPLWSPFGSDTIITYMISSGAEMLCAFYVTMTIVGGNVVLLVVTQYITVELELFILALKTLPERTLRLYESRYNIHSKEKMNLEQFRKNSRIISCCKYCLKENIIHHQKILQTFDEVEKVISVPIFIAYSSGSIMIAICGIVMIFGNGGIGAMLTAFVLGFGEVLIMLLISWCGEQIRQVNEKLTFALYSTKWYYLRKEETRTIHIMMCRSQRPLTLHAAGIVPLNFESFTNVMNSAYSYFNLVYASKVDSD